VHAYYTYDSQSIEACLMSLNEYFFKKNKYLEKGMFLQAKMVSLQSKNLAKCVGQPKYN
jgi:hypothetical protein